MRHQFEDSGEEYEMDIDQRTRGGRSGRIILLGDGTEVLTDSDETEMFDHEEEDKDLDAQVAKGQPKQDDEVRGQREETPAPEPQNAIEKQQTPELIERNHPEESSSTMSEEPKATETADNVKTINESALPEKLVTPPTNQDK